MLFDIFKNLSAPLRQNSAHFTPVNNKINILTLTKHNLFVIIVATIKQMLSYISGDCVRINIMVGEQGSRHTSSHTDIKVHL